VYRSRYDHGKPIVLQNAEGEATTPSVVYFESKDNVVVGQAAKEVASIYSDLCVSWVNASWATQAGSAGSMERSIDHRISPHSSYASWWDDAEKITGEKIEDVVITCPAYFGTDEKKATQQAGILAGLNVRSILLEPTAAALAYGIDQDQNQVILVYDLGGGTFDVTVVEIRRSEINVICTGGDHQLGGKDWDDAIVLYLTRKFEEVTGTSADTLLDDQETYQEVLNTAERCKKVLSSRQSVTEAIQEALSLQDSAIRS
jgi:molecular chaperone DnaK